MPAGNDLGIINTTNHLSPVGGKGAGQRGPPAPPFPQEVLASILLPLPRGLGEARLCSLLSCWSLSVIWERRWQRR